MPTGSVNFMIGNTSLGISALNGSGVATLNTLIDNALTSPKPIRGVYGGDSGDQTSTSDVLNVDVSKAPTTVSVVSSLNPSTPGQAITFTATVTSPTGNPPNGENVTFRDGTTVLGTGPLGSGSATYTTSALPPGPHHQCAVFPRRGVPRKYFAFAQSEVVAQPPTTVALTASINPVFVNQNTTLTATVSSGAVIPPEPWSLRTELLVLAQRQ